MTKKEALYETIRIWRILRDNGYTEKFQAGGASNYLHQCPCCEYTMKEAKKTKLVEDKLYISMSDNICALYCPMWDAWGFDQCEEDPNISPYRAWEIACARSDGMYDQEFFAAVIVEWAEYLYEELEVETMKTMSDWNESTMSFNDFVSKGDRIDEDMYMYFLSVVPPKYQGNGFFIMGEPNSHNMNGECEYLIFSHGNNRYYYEGCSTIAEAMNPNRVKYLKHKNSFID